jgi:2-hydroxycyclohexanecarboxyl-CoA dehydrogenase
VAGEISGHAVELDVTDLDSAKAAVEASGTLDVLVNNAGTDEFGFFTYTTPEQWKKVIDVNLGGVLNCTFAALPGMQQAGYGRIVNMSSEAGRVGSKGSAVYSAAKGGVVAFSKTIARENARYGITANSIAPGPIETPLLMGAKELGEMGEKIIETMKSLTQIGRLGRPEEVAAAVAFLASDDATYVTGETLGVSGGLGMV